MLYPKFRRLDIDAAGSVFHDISHFLFEAAPVAEWVRPLVFSALNRSSSYRCWFASLARVTCETSHVLLAGGWVVFLGDLPFSPHLAIDSAQNEWNNLDGPWNPNQKKKKKWFEIKLPTDEFRSNSIIIKPQFFTVQLGMPLLLWFRRTDKEGIWW